MRRVKNLYAKAKAMLKKGLLQAVMGFAGAERLKARQLYLSTNQVYLAYHPDSHCDFASHPEFGELLARFTAHNLSNNGGDIPRLWSLILNIKQILSEGIEGDFAELGVWRGNTAAVLAYYAQASGRRVFLFDTYEGFKEEDLVGVDANKKSEFADTSVEMVKGVVGVERGQCHYVKGHFPGTISDEHQRTTYAVVGLDCDLYEPMKAGLEFFYPRMSKGGVLFLHDYSSLYWDGAKKAIDEFCRKVGEFVMLLPDKSGSAFLRKTK
jgi:hypothetical protein